MDVIKLTEMLDMSLQHLQARETGICPIRRALYSQCFDEIIRQVEIILMNQIIFFVYNSDIKNIKKYFTAENLLFT